MRAFVSFEVFLALLFAVSAFAFLLPSHPPSYSVFYQYQLAQDFLEVSISNQELFWEIVVFEDGSSGVLLQSKYASLIEEAGDYCLELKAGGKTLKANCENGFSSKISVSRMVFDGEEFFELQISLSS